MFKRIVLASMAILAITSAPATAQVTLQWKLKEGEKFFLEEKSVTKMTIKIMGNAIDQTQTMTKITEVVVKSRTRDAIVMEMKIESVASTMEVMGMTIDVGDQLDALFKNLTFTVTMTPEGKVTKFVGYDQFAKNVDMAIANGDDAKKTEMKMVKAMLSEETFKTGCSTLFDLLPVGAVKMGERWKREQSIAMGPMGSFKLALDLTYKGPGEGDTEKIDAVGTFSHVAGKGDAGDALFKISKLDLSQKKIDGKLIFDKKTNRLSLVEMRLLLGGSMTIEVMGNDVPPFDFDGTEVRTTRLLEKRPTKE